MAPRTNRRSGFSLVELVIVIVIIGVIAAIAVPRISRGAKGAADAALTGDLTAMRNAIDLYAAEHSGNFPTVAKFKEQLTTYTDDAGADVATKDTTHIFGPYLKAVPGLPVGGTGTTGGAKGDTVVAASDGAGVGWIYDEATGHIEANTGTAKDESDTLYSDY
jgi:general secretion pathway protein G